MGDNNNSTAFTPTGARSGLSLRRRAKTTATKLKVRRDLFEEQHANKNNETPVKNATSQPHPSNTRTTRSGTKAKVLTQPSISSTPRNIGLPRLTESTNCRPYRLTLNRNIRKQLTKKRLEFHLANEAEKQPDDSEDDAIAVERPPQEIKLELIKEILATQKELQSIATQEAKVKDVSQAIARWRTGFAQALDDLHGKLEPKMDKAALLDKLGIEQNMLKRLS